MHMFIWHHSEQLLDCTTFPNQSSHKYGHLPTGLLNKSFHIVKIHPLKKPFKRPIPSNTTSEIVNGPWGKDMICLLVVCLCSITQLCLTLCDPTHCIAPGSSCPWDFPGKNTEVSCHSHFQGILPLQVNSLKVTLQHLEMFSL